MKIKIYRSLNKISSQTKFIESYQWPIHFTAVKSDIEIDTDRYYDILLETEVGVLQGVPQLNTKEFSYLREIKARLDRKIIVLEDKLLRETDIAKVVEYKLTCVNYYCKLMDIFPTLDIIERVSLIMDFFVKQYNSLDGLTEFQNYWAVFSTAVHEKLTVTAERISGLLVLDNYNRLNLVDHPSEFPEGYIMNNRVGFSEFMTKFSNKSMSPPPRIIKNYNLSKSNTANLHNIILSTQQKFVSDYLNDNTPYRGLLLYHGLGSGKSGASIAITNGYKNKQIVILLPASLRINYLQEIEKFGESLFKPNLNWEFFNFDTDTVFGTYKWISDTIVSNLPQFNDSEITFTQTVYDRYVQYKTTGTGTVEDKTVGGNVLNIETALRNNLFMHLEELGISNELLTKIVTTHDGMNGIWLLNNNFGVGDVIQNKLTKNIFTVVGVTARTIQLRTLPVNQLGGAKCSLCGALGVTKRNCPLNDLAVNPNFEKHLEATKILASSTAEQAAVAAQSVISDLDTMSYPTLKTPIQPDVSESGAIHMDGDIVIPITQIEDFLHYTIHNNFTSDDKKSICQQIKTSFKHKCKLCSYNAGAYTVINLFQKLMPNFSDLVQGKTSSQITTDDIDIIMSKINNSEIANPFNDKVVVIDEIHNLISLIMPSGDSVNFNGGVIFELLVRAENIKLVCLSGTPSINDVFEFSILYNILNGLIKSFEFQLFSKETVVSLDYTKITGFLETYNLLDRFTVSKNVVNITRLPNNFIKKTGPDGNYTGVERNTLNNMRDDAFIQTFLEDFQEAFPSYTIQFHNINIYNIFNGIVDTTKSWNQRIIGGGIFVSEQITNFKNNYIDQDDNLMYSRNFKNNIMGMTSFYNERKTDNEGVNIFPEVDTESVNLDFSMYQFIKYCYAREEERKKEKMSRLNKFIKGSASIKSSFKTTTRQLSIFAFPPDIVRVSKKNSFDVAYVLNEIEQIIIQLASGEDTVVFKTPMHEKMYDRAKELKELKNLFLSEIITTEIISECIRLTLDPIELLANYVRMLKSQGVSSGTPPSPPTVLGIKIKINIVPTGYVRDDMLSLIEANRDFLGRLCSTIVEQCETHQRPSTPLDTDAIIVFIHAEFDQHYLTYNPDLDKESILNDIIFEEEYEDALAHQIERLVESDVYLDLTAVVEQAPYNLSWLSPKYVSIFTNILNTPGSSFVYSQYLSAEGIGIFTEVLKKNGFEELKWSRQAVGEVGAPTITDTVDKYSWCSITSDKKEQLGQFIVNPALSPGNLVRWTRENADLKIISTTHRILSVDSMQIVMTSECQLETMYQSRDFTKFNTETTLRISMDRFGELSRCRFVLWTGKQTNTQERIDILKKFNGEENKYGQECLILLATSSGAEGISLKQVRQVHIMEPYWNNVRKTQVIGRARRVKSHMALAEEDRNVKVFLYVNKFADFQLGHLEAAQLEAPDILQLIADINHLDDSSETRGGERGQEDNIQFFLKLLTKFTHEINQIDKGKSTDEYLTIIAGRKEKLLNKFLYMIKESSVDCVLNLDENRDSDPVALSELECHAPDVVLDNLDINAGYTYKFNPLVKPERSRDAELQDEKKTLRSASKKYQILNFTINNTELGLDSVNLKCVLFPLKDKRDIPNNTVLYNYYSFISINFIQPGELIKIGKFVDSNLELTPDFLQYVKLFSVIDQCETAVKLTNPEFNSDFLDNDQKMLKFSGLVKKKYLERIRVGGAEVPEPVVPVVVVDTQWECPLCDTINEVTDAQCTNADCDMEFEDI